MRPITGELDTSPIGTGTASILITLARSLENADEELQRTRGDIGHAKDTIPLLKQEVLTLAKMENVVDQKVWRIINEFHDLMGKLRAKEAALSQHYQDLKMHKRTASLTPEQDREMKELGAAIRELEELVGEIQVEEMAVVKDATREISMQQILLRFAKKGTGE